MSDSRRQAVGFEPCSRWIGSSYALLVVEALRNEKVTPGPDLCDRNLTGDTLGDSPVETAATSSHLVDIAERLTGPPTVVQLGWHGRGQGFESPKLHQRMT